MTEIPSRRPPGDDRPGGREPDPLLQRAVQRVRDLLDADVASVAMADPSGRLAWRAMVGYRTQSIGPVPPGAHLVHLVMAEGQARTITLDPAERESRRAELAVMAAEGVQTGLGIPLALDDQPVGALLIGWRRPYAITASEQRLVQALADQVVSTISLVRLYEATWRQRSFLERLIQHVPAGIVAFDLPDFRVREVNRFYLRFLEEPFRSGTVDLHGRRLDEFIPQAVESGVQGIFERVASTGEPFTINEFEYRGFKRGTTYWNWSLVPLTDLPGGPVTGVLMLTTESTEQVRDRQRLAEALETARNQASELETVIQQMVEGVAIADRDGNLVKLNSAGVALLGQGVIAGADGVDYAERYQLYTPAGQLCPADQLPLERARRGETVLAQDLVVRQPDGRERVISVSAAPLVNEVQEIAGSVAVFHDVTKAREVERVKDEFLAIVSHELRTPLAAILGYSDIMLRGLGGPLNEKQRQNQQAIKNNATRLLGLINDLLDVSKLEAHGVTLNASALALQDLIPKSVAWVQVLATSRGVIARHRVGSDVPAVWGDEDRLHQVLTNLLSNAIKFTPPGGTVEIGARPSGLAPDAAPDSPEPAEAPDPPASVLVTVADTGVGLNDEQLTRIWDRFYQADSTSSRRYGGTGLGLAIVKNLIELHGGQVWATSAGRGQGSTFHFRLPPAPASATVPSRPAAPAIPAPGAEPPGTQPPLVLVIEDHRDLAVIARTMLEEEGYRVAVAYDGQTGIAMARELRPAAIMLDVLLPQANGWDVLEQFKRDPLTANIPVVVVSILEHQRLGLLLGATEYLVKPFERTQFVATLHRLVSLAGSRPRVLIVDDEPAIRQVLSTVLEEEGYAVYTADDGVVALDKIVEAQPSMLLLDLMLPRLDGFAVLKWIRAHPNPAIREMPIVLITAKDVTPEERDRLLNATEELISKVGMSFDQLLDVVKETLKKLHVPPGDHHNSSPAR